MHSLAWPAAGVVLAVLVAVVALAWRGHRRRGLLAETLDRLPEAHQVTGRNGRSVYSNRACRDLLQSPGQRLIDALRARMAEDDGDAIVENFDRAVAARAAHSQQIRIARQEADSSARSDGFDVLEVGVRPLDGSDHVLWSAGRATAERRLKTAGETQWAPFADFLEHAPIGFYSVDEAGRFLFVNRTLAEWLEYRPQDLVAGLGLADVLADLGPDEQAIAPGALVPDASTSGDRAYPQQLRVGLRTRSGQVLEVEITQAVDRAGEGLPTCGVVRDLGTEAGMANALSVSRRRFQWFFDEAPTGIAFVDRAGAISDCNRAFARMLQAPREKLLGGKLADLVAGESRSEVEAALASGGGSQKKGGQGLEVQFAAEPQATATMYVTDAGGETAEGAIVHFIDVSERKALEEQFVQSQKMQAVGQLAGGIAHDFNNLLTAMIGFCDLLLLRHPPGDQSFADIMQIKQNANRAANLVRQLLAFSRQQTLRPQVLDITNVLAEISHLLRRLIGGGIQLEMVHGRDLGRVKVDQGQLEQVIINLAVNARDAMADGGTLTIRTRNELLRSEMRLGGEVLVPGRYVVIEVADTGCGIAPEDLGRIFDPFFSTKEMGAGTGLGLSTVYGIVRQTGGVVRVESEVGQGTNFSIYLPHHAPCAPEEESAEAARVRDLTGMGTVLLVEDEDAVRAFSARALTNKGYRVLEAPSAEAALEILAGQDERIDLMITDVVMPGLDGPALVGRVRAEQPDMKILFISGYTEDSVRRRLDREKDVHFLAKPFSLRELAGKVKELMQEPAGA